MRKRATFAVLAAASALGGFTGPAAYADETVGDIQIVDVSVNGGKSIAVGLADKTVTVSVTAADPSGIWDADFYLWRGTDPDNPDGYITPNEDTTPADCVASSATTSTCSKTFTFEPDWWLTNADAGTWKVGVDVWANDDSWTQRDAYTTTRLQRYSKLTVNAGPEPIAKGKTLKVTGKLTRANWDTDVYAGYTARPVKLQFRKAGTSTYTTIKTVSTSSTGDLQTTTTASVDGYWRWNFAGTTTTPAVSATGDYVDVQ
ncbi:MULTISPECIES: calcium-binding protein [unclassified Streptomyces]|uniref:calcium-binding protein n=1 Tax=unclassified Streptomyces TaxID=2593676 RepID=UPI002257DB2B|nr:MULTISPECIES: calcium-binding protein [unclassified Streptomyces]MCX4990301.1 calcium-binding protein [Streptomyces sp. NBC_00568]MCX5004468.1 calcium-binding protein [Streptomyces sp. NBC_00638]